MEYIPSIIYFYIIRLDPNLFLRGAPRAFHSCIRSDNELFISGGMQAHKGKWGTGGDIWSTGGSLNGWKRLVFIFPWKIFQFHFGYWFSINDNLGNM